MDITDIDADDSSFSANIRSEEEFCVWLKEHEQLSSCMYRVQLKPRWTFTGKPLVLVTCLMIGTGLSVTHHLRRQHRAWMSTVNNLQLQHEQVTHHQNWKQMPNSIWKNIDEIISCEGCLAVVVGPQPQSQCGVCEASVGTGHQRYALPCHHLNNDAVSLKEADDFLSLHRGEFTDRVLSAAHASYRVHGNTLSELPDEEDLKQLKQFVMAQISHWKDALTKNPDVLTWHKSWSSMDVMVQKLQWRIEGDWFCECFFWSGSGPISKVDWCWKAVADRDTPCRMFSRWLNPVPPHKLESVGFLLEFTKSFKRLCHYLGCPLC